MTQPLPSIGLADVSVREKFGARMDTMYAAWNVWRADIVREMLARVDAIGAEVDEDLAELGNGPLQRLFQTLFGPDMEDGVTKLAELRMEMERLPIGDERSKATNRYFDAIAATESVAELKAELESLPEGRARHRAAALFLGVWDGADDTWNEPEGKMVRCAGESLEILCRAWLHILGRSRQGTLWFGLIRFGQVRGAWRITRRASLSSLMLSASDLTTCAPASRERKAAVRQSRAR